MCGGKMKTKFFTLAVTVKNLSNIRTLTIASSTDRLLKQILSHATYFGGPHYSLHMIHFTRWMNENQLSLGEMSLVVGGSRMISGHRTLFIYS